MITEYNPETKELTIKIKLASKQEAPLSSTGKSKVLAGTSGFTWISFPNLGEIGVSLNVIATRR